MKILKFKFFLAITFATALTFTSCSKEEIETSNPIAANNIANQQMQNSENTTANKSSETANIDKYIWNVTDKNAGNETVANRAECRIKICVDLGPNSTYTVYGAPQTFTYTGPYFGCVSVPFNSGETRDVEYEGTGGVYVYQIFKYSPVNIFECPLWNVNATNSETHKSTTIRPQCKYCP